MNIRMMDHFMKFAFQTNDQQASFGLDNATVPITTWQGGSKNLDTAGGKLTLDNKPVQGAILRADQYTLPSPTGSDGSFGFLRDMTVLQRRVVSVADSSRARISGQSLSHDQQNRLQAVTASVNTIFKITLDKESPLTPGKNDAQLSGKLTFADDTTPVPPVALWDYLIKGVIRDSKGNPLENAVASISGEGGESSAISNLTDKTGQYQMRFFPDPDNDYAVRTGYGTELYASPETIHFTPGASVTMDLVLPKTGTVLQGTGKNGKLAPKEVPGAEYIGTMIGVASAQGLLAATVTWPDDRGRFKITIPSVPDDGPISFYQAQLRFFSSIGEKPGGTISADAMPTKLEANMPRNLDPLTVAKS